MSHVGLHQVICPWDLSSSKVAPCCESNLYCNSICYQFNSWYRETTGQVGYCNATTFRIPKGLWRGSLATRSNVQSQSGVFDSVFHTWQPNKEREVYKDWVGCVGSKPAAKQLNQSAEQTGYALDLNQPPGPFDISSWRCLKTQLPHSMLSC